MKFVRAILLMLLLPALLAARQQQAASSDIQLSRLGESIKAKLDELRGGAEFPGATAGVVLPDGRSLSVSTGFSDLERKIALAPRDLMLAGSIGKTYVAAVMLQLVQEGKARLDDRAGRWLSGERWFSRLPNADSITLRMLMNHTSGISEHVLNKDLAAALRANPDKAWS